MTVTLTLPAIFSYLFLKCEMCKEKKLLLFMNYLQYINMLHLWGAFCTLKCDLKIIGKEMFLII